MWLVIFGLSFQLLEGVILRLPPTRSIGDGRAFEIRLLMQLLYAAYHAIHFLALSSFVPFESIISKV